MRSLIRGLPAALLMAAAVVLAPYGGAAAPENAPLGLTGGGVQFRDLVEGAGTPLAEGQHATIHLVMWLDDAGRRGPELYNSRADREPVSFVVGAEFMMPALNEGVQGMKPGGRRLLLVPPALAYGASGLGDVVPPDTPIMFLVDLLDAGDGP